MGNFYIQFDKNMFRLAPASIYIATDSISHGQVILIKGRKAGRKREKEKI
jgi:hypothetical protein